MARCEFISRATTFLFMLLASVIAAVAQEVPAAISLTVAEDASRLRPIPEAIYSTPLPLAVRLPGLSKDEGRRLSRRGGITRAGVRRRLAPMSYRPLITASTDGQVVKFAISSPGALQMRIHFRNFDVGNAEVWVHAPGAEFAPAPYRNKGIFADGEFWSASVMGDTAVISVLRDSAPSWSGMPFEIDQVVHYWPTLDQSADDPVGANPAAPASCHLDVTCYASFNLAAKAVALYSLISSDDDNVYLCSGSLINTRAGSLKPYFLTAHHCVQNSTEARTVEAWFFYQSTSCNGLPDSTLTLPRVLGAQYLAGGDFAHGDFALLELTSAPAGAYFLGWNTTLAAIAPVVGIHHPRASFKRISFGVRGTDSSFIVEDQVAPADAYYLVGWTSGLLEPGSSGSPLLNSTDQIVGVASAASVSPPGLNICEIPQFARYGRFSEAFTSLRPYLDDGPPSALSVNLSTLTFQVNDGVASAPRTLTVTTQSTTPLGITARSNQSWIYISGPSSVSSSSPANFSVLIDPTALRTPGTASGNITISSPSTTSVSMSVSVTISITKSVVTVSVTPNPVFPQLVPGASWSFTVRAVESAGVSTRLTGFRIGSSDFSSRIANFFGTEGLNARSTISAPMVITNRSAPVTETIELSGVDVVTGRAWVAASTVSLLGTATRAVTTLSVVPNPVRQNPNAAADCQWSHQIQLRETVGLPVQLTRFIAGGFDLSNKIREYFGSTSLGANGLLNANLCWSNMTIPTTLNFELAGTDARGNTVSVQAQASFLGTAPITVPFTVSPNTVNFSGTMDSLVRPQIQVTAGGPSVAWSASIAFGSNQVPWLNASPVAGTGSGTITLSPVGNLGPGSYQATLIIQAPTAVPQTLNIPISLLLLAAGSALPAISSNGLVNGASFQPGAAPGMLMSIFGTNLATSTAQASSVPLPMALGGTSVTVNGLAAPVYYASPGQLNIQVPYEAAPGTGQVTVDVGGRTATSPVMISSSLPGIFASNGRIAPFPSGRSGDSLMLFVTGHGVVSPAVATGTAPPVDLTVDKLPRPTVPVTLTIGGRSAPVLFAGIPSDLVGVMQINFQVPDSLPAGDHPVIVTVGSQQTLAALFTVVP